MEIKNRPPAISYLDLPLPPPPAKLKLDSNKSWYPPQQSARPLDASIERLMPSSKPYDAFRNIEKAVVYSPTMITQLSSGLSCSSNFGGISVSVAIKQTYEFHAVEIESIHVDLKSSNSLMDLTKFCEEIEHSLMEGTLPGEFQDQELKMGFIGTRVWAWDQKVSEDASQEANDKEAKQIKEPAEDVTNDHNATPL